MSISEHTRGPTRWIDPAARAARALRTALGGDGVRLDADRLDRRDPTFIAEMLPAFQIFNARYLRLRVEGAENVPRAPALFVGNHNGGIAGPDLACTLATLWEALGPAAPVYALAHDFAMRHCPPLGRVAQRFGAIRACPENAARALDSGASVLVYPGGDLDAYRHSRRRDEVVLGRRTGFVRVAQRARVPVVPVVAHGAHRSAYIFSEGEEIARRMRLKHWGRLERFPLALALPWGLALGPWLPYLPLPFPVRLKILAPEMIDAAEDPASARERIRARMQQALDGLARPASECTRP